MAFTSTAAAQSALTEYRSQALRIDPGFYTAVDLRRLDGTHVPFSHFGDELDLVFSGNAEALAAAQTFRDMRIAGTALSLAGLAVLLSELVLILVGHDTLVNDRETGADGLRPLTFVLLGTGLGLNIGGILLEVSSLSALDDAVQSHNRGVLSRVRGRAEVKVSLGF